MVKCIDCANLLQLYNRQCNGEPRDPLEFGKEELALELSLQCHDFDCEEGHCFDNQNYIGRYEIYIERTCEDFEKSEYAKEKEET